MRAEQEARNLEAMMGAKHFFPKPAEVDLDKLMATYLGIGIDPSMGMDFTVVVGIYDDGSEARRRQLLLLCC